MSQSWRGLAVLLILSGCTSCSTLKFYGQAIQGQMQILNEARPVEEVKRDPQTADTLRKRLVLVDELRTFASKKLKLPVNKQYRSYTDLHRKYVVWVVYASPEFSLESKTWNYPFLGKLKYRGFFKEAEAESEVAKLRERKLDVMKGGVRVYSTLGLLPDPILNTFIFDEDHELAETVFHELTHGRFFASGDTDFNEAYATAVGQEGVRQWLEASGKPGELAKYERHLQLHRRALAMMFQKREALRKLYTQHGQMPDAKLRQMKEAIFDEMLVEYADVRNLSASKRKKLLQTRTLERIEFNNARLAALSTYHDLVPAFTRFYEKCDGDWEKFHRAVAAMRFLTPEERRKRLGVPNIVHEDED